MIHVMMAYMPHSAALKASLAPKNVTRKLASVWVRIRKFSTLSWYILQVLRNLQSIHLQLENYELQRWNPNILFTNSCSDHQQIKHIFLFKTSMNALKIMDGAITIATTLRVVIFVSAILCFFSSRTTRPAKVSWFACFECCWLIYKALLTKSFYNYTT